MVDITYHDAEIKSIGVDNVFLADRVLDRMSLPPELASFLDELIVVIRAEWGDDVWRLFDENAEVKILSVKKWFLSFTFRVKHCEALIRLLVGPRPV